MRMKSDYFRVESDHCANQALFPNSLKIRAQLGNMGVQLGDEFAAPR